ncbi:hypothetical protein [Vulgatibacter incomptus]|uniref:Uncharacterized protein n=1 Tax=Vulgatibacter incomptus TaxID=1391653 RepID=A0A0K1PHM2_9BACT|nr:hypothetical protein [Vulgatibacter incomptus]AKU93038.1 hypothetical protein AKJ08_3425 [Vulgatibacter incomptus]
MKILCEACNRLGPPSAWSVDGNFLRLRCGGCGGEQAVRGEPTAPRGAPAGAGPTRGAAATPEFPSLYSAGEGEQDPVPPIDAAPSEDWLERGWARVLTCWNDPAAHEALVAEAAARGSFAELGGLYRRVIETRPTDERALAAREEILRRATAHLMVTLPSQERGLDSAQVRKVQAWVFGLFLVLLGGFALFLFAGR